MIEAVLFDLGDTLIDFRGTSTGRILDAAGRSLYRQLLEGGFRPPAIELYIRRMKRPLIRSYLWSHLTRREINLVRTIYRMHHRMGLHIDFPQCEAIVHQSIAAVYEMVTKDECAEQAVGRLSRAGYKLGIVSNTWLPGAAINDFLRRQRLLSYFSVRIYSSEVRYMKPSRKIFRLALDQLGVAADRTLFVGDRRYNDIRGAARMGMKTVLFLPQSPLQHGRGRPDFVVGRLSDVPDLLESGKL